MPHDLPDPSAPAPRRRRVIGATTGRLCALVTLLAVNWVAYLLITGRPLPTHWLIQLALATLAIASTAGVLLHHHLHWTRPTRRLLADLRQVRAGDLPIDELSRIEGGPAPLVAVVQDLLRDLRRQRAAYTELELELSQRVANRTAALERKLGMLQQQASRDPLTGLYNRRLLDEHLPRLITESMSANAPLALLMIDVDHFKYVNDTLGHPAGDQVLTDIGHLIRGSIREQDLAFRFGGDEFVILLTDQSAAQAASLADRLVSLMDHLARTLRVEPPPRLSIGIAALRDLPHPTADTLLALADQRLYAIKHARRPAA